VRSLKGEKERRERREISCEILIYYIDTLWLICNTKCFKISLFDNPALCNTYVFFKWLFSSLFNILLKYNVHIIYNLFNAISFASRYFLEVWIKRRIRIYRIYFRRWIKCISHIILILQRNLSISEFSCDRHVSTKTFY